MIAAGCDSSGTQSEQESSIIRAQAIDGYLVGSSVICDSSLAQSTTAAGYLECPANTKLIRVRGGVDVGFDETATSGTNPFIGELAAPGDLKYVTPLSTVAVALASNEGIFDPEQLPAATETLKRALAMPNLDLNSDASTEIDVIKANAQLHEIISGFAVTADEYAIVTRALADLVAMRDEQGATFAIGATADQIVVDLNNQLVASNSRLALSVTELSNVSQNVQLTNSEIEAAESRHPVALAAQTDVTENYAIAFKRDIAPVGIETSDPFYRWGYITSFYTLDDLESDTLINNRYPSVIGNDMYAIMFDRNAVVVNKTLEDTTVSLGFELTATAEGDKRSIALTTTGALLSMTDGDSSTIDVNIPQDTLTRIRTVDADGVVTEGTYLLDEARFIQSVSDRRFLQINSRAARKSLKDKGLSDPTEGDGNYRFTIVINGIKINMIDDDENYRATTYTVNSGQDSITGSGFQGYVSVVGR